LPPPPTDIQAQHFALRVHAAALQQHATLEQVFAFVQIALHPLRLDGIFPPAGEDVGGLQVVLRIQKQRAKAFDVDTLGFAGRGLRRLDSRRGFIHLSEGRHQGNPQMQQCGAENPSPVHGDRSFLRREARALSTSSAVKNRA